ncbi:MAG: glycosyltransferase family 39 protein [Candidatus Parvarchaeota archaeon]
MVRSIVQSKIEIFISRYRYLLAIVVFSIIIHWFELGSVPPVVFTDEIDPFVSTLALMQGHGVQLTADPHSLLNILTITINLEWQSILLFGPTTFAIRFPGIFFTVLLIISTYLLSNLLFGNRVAILSSFLVSISPIIFQGSRVFYQIPIVASVSFLTAATYLLIKYSDRRPELKGIIASSIIFSFDIAGFVNIYSRLLAFVLLLVIAIKSFFSELGTPVARKILFLFVLPLSIVFLVTVVPEDLSPLTVAASVHSTSFYFSPSQNLLLDGGSGIKEFLSKYCQYFLPKFLFVSGDINPTQNTGLTGEMLYPSALFLYLGIAVTIYRFLKGAGNRFPYALMFIWLTVAPVVGSASIIVNYTDSSNGILMVPVLQIFSSIGIVYLVEKVGGIIGNANRQKKKKKVKSAKAEGDHKITILDEKRGKMKRVVVIIVVVAYLLSFTYFSYGYFVVHPADVEDSPPTWAEWGFLFGFPEVAQFINEYRLFNMPIYVSPHGLFSNNSSVFHYFYYVQRVPESYLEYYTDGRVNNFDGIANVSSFYSPKAALIISGYVGDISSLRAQGLIVSDIFNVKRPNGQVAMLLIYVFPKLSSPYVNELKNYVLSVSDVYTYYSINNSEITEIGNNFSAIVTFEIPYRKYEQNNFYYLMLANPLPFKAPRFGFRIGSLSMEERGGSNSTMTLNSFLYTNHGNYSTEPGTFAQIWADGIPLSYNVTYYAALVYSGNYFYLYLNGTNMVAFGELNYPLAPMSSSISFDLNFNATIQNFILYNFGLTGAQVGYLYYNGIG